MTEDRIKSKRFDLIFDVLAQKDNKMFRCSSNFLIIILNATNERAESIHKVM